MCFMLLLLLIFISSVICSKVCQIDVPIGTWLKNNGNRSCEIVKGHFILDRSANSVSGEIYKTFEGLKRIEGCIYVKNYTGSRNLSFFSNLEDVICNETAATASNLKDVIHVHGPYLYTMGLHSLKNVTGPGEIYLSFEDNQETYQDIYNQEMYQDKEMVFLARHPQFIGKMYRACETKDPCFRPELFNEFYTFEDIPDNCTVFAGLPCIVGPYPQDRPSLEKFKNLTLLIGQLEVGPTLFTSLEMFSSLEVIYPCKIVFKRAGHYGNWIIDMNGHPWHPCYDSMFTLEKSRGIQRIFVGVSRFMEDISLPSLQPIRPLQINQPIATRSLSQWYFDYILYFPEEFPEPCTQFPQFENCISTVGVERWDTGENTPRNIPLVEEAWLAGTCFVIVGFWYGKRCLVTIITRQLHYSFGKSQYLIGTVLLIMVLSAIEAVIINQVARDTDHTKNQEHYIFAEFHSPLLLHQFSLEIIKFLAACRQTSLIILIFCCLDIIVSQRPHYTDGAVTYMVFVMNIDGQVNFLKWCPAHTIIPTYRQFIQFLMTRVREENGKYSWSYFGPNEMQLEINGGSFSQISLCCDIVFGCLIAIFVVLKIVRRIKSKGNFLILILLYIQMSMNRIRSFINYDILTEFIDHATDVHKLRDRFFYPPMESLDYEEEIWKIARIVEKLPYFSFMIISYICWNYIQYYRRLGLALLYREQRQKKEALRPNDCSSLYNTFSISEKTTFSHNAHLK